MNVKTKIYYALARMYEYVKDIYAICEARDFDYENIIENMISKHAVNMCLVQIGERAKQIKDANESFYRNSDLMLPQIKGMRDRITHSYGDIDYKIIKSVLKNDIPTLKKAIEANVHPHILDNPYVLYDMEYDDYLASFSNSPVKTALDLQIQSAASRNTESHSSCMRKKESELEI